MSQEQAFIRAIRRRPGSRAERLVYADWLMDRGDPRGEFIRLQLEARGLSRGSPKRLDLEARAHELLLTGEAAWLGPLLGVVGNWEWSGGLLRSVTVAADVFLANASRWLPALPLLGVHLRQARPHVAALAACEQLRHVSGLYLGDNELTDDGLEVLLRSPHLKWVRSLYLQSNQFRPRAFELLARTPNLPRLRELCLGHNHIGDEGMAALATRGLGPLRVLQIPMTFVAEAGVRALAGSALLSGLRVLALGFNQLPPGCVATLAASPAFAGVRVLDCTLNQPDDGDVAALAGSPHAAGLRHLSLLTHDTLGDASLKALAASRSLARLRSLSLGPGRWSPAGVRALGRSRTLTALRSLQLGAPSASAPHTANENAARRVAKALLGQPLVRRLRQLDLDATRVSKEGLAALASHPRPLRLRELTVPLSRGLVAAWEGLLAKGLLPDLTALSLMNPPAGAVRALLTPGRLPELRRLTLYGLPSLREFQALLDSSLFRRLHQLRISLSYKTEDRQGEEVVHRLCAAWSTSSLQRLGLLWSLSPDAARILAQASPPPALTELEVGAFRMRAEGMAALAGSPLLGQLRWLVLTNSSAQAVPGLEALADSPHVGPLLRVNIRNGHAPAEAHPAIRRRFGTRFAVSGRSEPRRTTRAAGAA